jgi:hypothetical protein
MAHALCRDVALKQPATAWCPATDVANLFRVKRAAHAQMAATDKILSA